MINRGMKMMDQTIEIMSSMRPSGFLKEVRTLDTLNLQVTRRLEGWVALIHSLGSELQ